MTTRNHPHTSSRIARAVGAGLALAIIAGTAAALPGPSASADDVTIQPGGHDSRATVLQLKTGNVELTGRGLLAQAGALPHFGVLVVDRVLSADERAQIEATGAKIRDYLPDRAYVVDLRHANAGSVRGLARAAHLAAFDSAWKVSPELGNQVYQQPEIRAAREAGNLPLIVHAFGESSLADMLAQLSTIDGVNIVTTASNLGQAHAAIIATPESVDAIATIDAVQWIEDAPEAQLRNGTAHNLVQSGNTIDSPLWDHGLTGQGQIVGMMDGRPSINHCMLSDPEGDSPGPNNRKYAAYNAPFGTDSHGTHVAGIVAGDNGSDGNGRGTAYEARIVFDDTAGSFGDQSTMIARLEQHYGQGAFVHTNSWGNDFTTSYDGWARGIDVFSWEHDDNVVLFACTNGSTLKNPENSKNVVGVGGSNDSTSGVNQFCTGGRGPTNDGRRKPEVFTPGCNITSSIGSGCSTTQFSGTSMACPAAAGATILIRQYYTEGYYPSGAATLENEFLPSGALLKATLLNATRNMTNVSGYPSNQEGWGRLVADDGLYFPGDARKNLVRQAFNNDEGALDTGDTYVIEFDVNSSSEPLKITLAYHDAPGSLNASSPAVNNLNLLSASPSGVSYTGNDMNTSTGESNAFGFNTDSINNVEQIVISAPETGRWIVEINAASVNTGTQGYGLVISGDVAEAVGGPCSGADIAEPFGTLNFADVQAFLGLFGESKPGADLAAPMGEFNFADVQVFLGLFGDGC